MHEYSGFIMSPAASGPANVGAIRDRRRTREAEAVPICRAQAASGKRKRGGSAKVPANGVHSFLNHLHYSLGSAFVPAVAFSCAAPADKIWQAQKRDELGEPH